MTTEEEFVRAVRKELEGMVVPGDGGKPVRMSKEWVDEVLAQRTWSGDRTLVQEAYADRGLNAHMPEKAWIEGVASSLWVSHSC